MRLAPLLAIGAVATALVAPAVARSAIGDPRIAGLQVALRAANLYAGDVDGIYGPETRAAVALLQSREGPAAAGRLAPTPLGSRLLARGSIGPDVAALQFLLAWHGFPSGALDGGFGEKTERALRRFEQWARLRPDGLAGPAVLAALRAPPARPRATLAWPLPLPVADTFGPRGARFHAGIDIPAPTRTPVAAAAAGRVVYAGWREGGWGYEVTIASGGGLRHIYAHLSQVNVLLGAAVRRGDTIGLVGASGDATGPHLHFELRLRGAAVDPLPTLSYAVAPTSAVQNAQRRAASGISLRHSGQGRVVASTGGSVR